MESNEVSRSDLKFGMMHSNKKMVAEKAEKYRASTNALINFINDKRKWFNTHTCI
jgi:hypothetical protein